MGPQLRYVLHGWVLALFLLQSGCGAFESWLHRPNTEKKPNTEKDDWSNWTKCSGMSLSSTGIKHDVFCLKDVSSNDTHLKPPVLLLHELPGLTPPTLRYAKELSKDFTVYVPMLFGKFGEESALSGPWAYWIGPWVFWTRQEWGISLKGSTPIVEWLRDVVGNIESKHQPLPVRIIGNCMTGALPLALLSKADGTVNANVDAVVLAQPALPMTFWWRRTKNDRDSLDMSNRDREAAESSQAKVLALRFETDWISPSEKQETLRAFSKDFKGQLITIEICAKDYDPEGREGRAHSTLIGEYDAVGKVGKVSEKARETVRKFLLDPINTTVSNSRCSSKVSVGSRLDPGWLRG